jgi:hypothetical protein
MELPVGLPTGGMANLSSRYMFYQTHHRKFLMEGTLARLPAGALRLLSRHFKSLADVPYVKYVVIHRDLLDDFARHGFWGFAAPEASGAVTVKPLTGTPERR